MNAKRILAFLTLPVLAAVGMLLPQGLSGQTDGAGVARLGGPGAVQQTGYPVAPMTGMMPGGPPMTSGYAPMMANQPSMAAWGMPACPDGSCDTGFALTEPTSAALFGPQMNIDVNFGEGLGYTEEFYRLNAMIPWHVDPGNSVLIFDGAAAVTDEGRGLYNAGLIWRNFDRVRNRIFGLNGYFDFDNGVNRDNGYKRVGFGFESLGQWIDVRANGYIVLGAENAILSDSLTGGCELIGHNIMVTRERQIESAFTGGDFEIGGPLPFLGRYGINGYVGGYVLSNDIAGETVGVSARAEAHINQAVTANVTYTNDDQLGTNAWAGLTVTLPDWRKRGWFKQRDLDQRMGDQVRRSNRIHTDVAIYRNQEAAVNPLDGRPYELLYVDPNAASNGDGSAENPFSSLESLADANRPNYDILSIAPRTDNTGTNLTVDGGLDLFDGQQLLGRTKSHRIFETDGVICDLPPLFTEAGDGVLAPMISNPSNSAGNYVVSIGSHNRVSGLRINGANADETDFGVGIMGRGEIENFEITCNTIFNHTDAVRINNAKGHGIFEDNILDGADPSRTHVSDNGLILAAAANETLTLSMQNNESTGHTGDGFSIIARPGSRIQANDPSGVNGPVTGIIGNTANENGTGFRMDSRPGSVINATVDGNTFNENEGDGFLAFTDAGRIVFRSFSGNTGLNNGGNGVFFRYRNGGRFYVLSEDANENGVLDPGEDINGNGVFDQGFVMNNLSGNGENGLCIFGQGSGNGFFDIGGPDPLLGNTFAGNADAGIAVDLTGTATGQIDAMHNRIIAGSGSAASLTMVLDFIDPGQAAFTDFLGNTMTTFDPTNFGFSAADFGTIQNAVLATVRDQFHGLPTSDVDPNSPIPPGMQLDIDFVIGDVGQPPSNGGSEYYSVVLGDSPGAAGLLGISDGIGQIRDQNGIGPVGPGAFGVTNFSGVLGEAAVVVYTDQISTLGGLTPSNARGVSDRANGLTSGILGFTRNAIANVTTHEVGHGLSLRHIADAGAVLPSTAPAGSTVVMGTGAPGFGQPNQALLEQQTFAISGNNPGEGGGEAPFTQMGIQQLVSALGLRTASTTGSTRDGMRIRTSNDAVLQPSRLLNNTVDGMTRDGIQLVARDDSRMPDVDIQGNTIQNNGRHGVNIEAHDNAFINVDRTIGGNGVNTLAGVEYSQRNIITGNGGDGIRALAADGGTVRGNVINNEITNNGGNGISLLIDGYGTVDFGDVSGSTNRLISDNEITGNSGFGIFANSDSTPGELSTMNIISTGNNISNNASGGLFANLTGTNNNPPTPPSPVINSRLSLLVDGEVIDGNGDVGVGVAAGGNSKADVIIRDSMITNTVLGTQFGGDGINFNRSGSALLTATVEDNTVTGNAGDGMETMYSGANRNDPTQPMSGTINTVTWNRNDLSNNGDNGVAFFGLGDGQLVADGMNNVINNNTSNGILVDTRQFSTFGDPSDLSFPPPGRRTVIKSSVITGNGLDGVSLDARDNSVQLAHITSDASADPFGNPHASGLGENDTLIANNGSDGVHVNAQDSSTVDVLIDSGSGNTQITGNGTGANGGNGVRFDAQNNSDSIVTVQDTYIAGNIAGASEDADGNGVLDFNSDLNRNAFLDGPLREDANGDGNLDAGEDTNGNGVLDDEMVLDSEDATGNRAFVDGNLDNDVENGDGIYYESSGNSRSTLQVGGTNLGNTIQENQDDGIAVVVRGGLSAAGSGVAGQPESLVNIVGNTIGGLNDGNEAGNLGDGLSINVTGGAFASPAYSGLVDGNGQPLIPFAINRQEIGPIFTANVRNNELSYNARRGANILLTGAGGVRNRENLFGGASPTFEPLLINFTNNVVRENGTQGVFYQANARFVENRIVFIPGNGAPGTGNGITGPYDPRHPAFFALNAGSLNGNSAYLPNYLNLRTAQNSMFIARDNTITSNGTALIGGEGEGLEIRVSQNAYVAADVTGNTFGGNLDADFSTSSFTVGGNPLNAIDYVNNAAVPNTSDVVFLDDTAQLDLRFDANSGNQINVTANGAFHTNTDPGKIGVIRPLDIFQVDGGPFLNSPNNIFNFQGNIQDIRAAYTAGDYFERSISDPLFPNIAFPPPLL